MSRISWRALVWTGASLIVAYALVKAGMSRDVETLVFAGFLILGPFLLGPVFVKLWLRVPKPRLEEYAPGHHFIAHENVTTHRAVLERLSDAGYAPAADMWKQARRQRARVTLLTTADARDIVLVTAPADAKKLGRKTPTSIEFRAVRPDGREQWVHNRVELSPFPLPQGVVVEQLAAVRDPLDLRRVHHTLAKGTSTARAKAPPLGDRAEDYLRRDLDDEYRRLVASGYLRGTGGGAAFRSTWKGAIAIAWKHVPPWSFVRWRRVRDRAAKVTAELSVRTPRAAPTPRAVTGGRVWWAGLAATLGILTLAGSGTPGLAVPIPFFSWVPSNYEGAVRVLERMADAQASPLMVHDSVGNLIPSEGRAVKVTEERAAALVRKAQPRFLRRGFYLFQYDYQYAGLLPTGDPYEVVRITAVNGRSDGVPNDSVVSWLRSVALEHPFVLRSLGYEFLELRFAQPVGDPEAVAQRVAQLCPDALKEGAGSVEAIANDIAQLQSVFCFWH